ncbi:winged helix-turn-helix transcriptional regulator [Nesterenkonia sandarakina]|uniref:Two-component system OmpR family response regulator n=1 Tax=Nesterenkonia sandarakina TaxID=272918 RepID=A0A7Z0E8U7_9MICC|nr:response regulator transcription factor [Nesterenkonia sandarakina]NYJ16765.1 two-component system OmpR family response regulator [Nesterenkonia sandarakina]
MAGENGAGPAQGSPETTLRPAEPPRLAVSSPVLILGGPSPAASELSQRLRGIDVKVLLASSAEAARQAIQVETPELFVVDARSSRQVSDMEQVLQDLRSSADPSAVLHWFDAGIELESVLRAVHPQDDHMAGAITVQEALRRLHFITARLPQRSEGERLLVGDLELDTAARTVRRGGRDIDLSDTEFRLLRLLMLHARTVLPKAEILQQVWEYEFAGQANIVELYISYVRKKIEADMPRMIHTVRGAGYVLRAAESSTAGSLSAPSAASG